jgi:hypothetical protein
MKYTDFIKTEFAKKRLVNNYLLVLLLLGGCASSPDFWHADAIATGNALYDSSRLIYDSPHSHLKLEFLKTGKDTAAYLFLDQFRFTPQSPDSRSTEVTFTIGETVLQESIYLREGRMRLKLSTELTERIIFALQEGKQVAIVANELKETIDPGSFQTAFAKFLKGSEPLNFIKGPFE